MWKHDSWYSLIFTLYNATGTFFNIDYVPMPEHYAGIKRQANVCGKFLPTELAMNSHSRMSKIKVKFIFSEN